MSYSPETEESLCTNCSEFWATITGKVFRYTKRGEEGTEVANEPAAHARVVPAGDPKTSTQPER